MGHFTFHVDALIAAAERGELDQVRRLLKVLVPEYQMADGRWQMADSRWQDRGTGKRGLHLQGSCGKLCAEPKGSEIAGGRRKMNTLTVALGLRWRCWSGRQGSRGAGEKGR